jgi:hypothetical protein
MCQIQRCYLDLEADSDTFLPRIQLVHVVHAYVQHLFHPLQRIETTAAAIVRARHEAVGSTVTPTS